MSPHNWDDFGNDSTGGGGGGEDDTFESSFGPPGEEEFGGSDEEWLDELMEEIQAELTDIADLRRTMEKKLEGEIDENLWLTLEFKLSTLPGPAGSEAVVSYLVEGEGETRAGEVDVGRNEGMGYARESVRERVEEGIELHPSSS
ncbi:MAG: hypothetical protein ABEL76_06795 [Bradymonadaceae bacterium]